jgi:hypothetical protein
MPNIKKHERLGSKSKSSKSETGAGERRLLRDRQRET